MPIISKDTWDKFTQEEKEKIRNEFALLKETEGEDLMHRVTELMVLFPEEALQPQPLTYEVVARELFEKSGKVTYGIGDDGSIFYFNWSSRYDFIKYQQSNLCTSRKQAEKLLTINRLLNVAKFLNGKDWKPDEVDGKLWAIGIEKYNKTIMPVEVGAYDFRTEIVYFSTQQLTQQAIQILGEDTVRLALDSNF